MKYPIAEVLWEDAWGREGWTAAEGIDPLLVRSVGFLVKKTNKGISLSGGYSPDNPEALVGLSFIPAGMVRKVKILAK